MKMEAIMAYTIDYLVNERSTGSETWDRSLSEAQDMARSAV
jgi:hypothetical protein